MDEHLFLRFGLNVDLKPRTHKATFYVRKAVVFIRLLPGSVDVHRGGGGEGSYG